MRTILIIVLGLFIAQNLNAQVDSLIIKLGDYGQLIVISPNLVKEKQKSFGLDESYQNFYNDFKKIDKSGFSDKNQIIKYSNKTYEPQYRAISIEAVDNEEGLFYFNEDKQESILPNKYKLEINAERKVIIIINSLDDLDKINQLSLDSLYLQSLKHIQSQDLNNRIAYKIFYSADNKQINENSNLIFSGKLQDFLLLDANIGMSIIDSRIAPEWGASIEFDFRKKGLVNLRFGINYTLKHLYDRDDIFNISNYGFLSLNYYFKYNNSYNQKLSIGYMVNKSGNDFNGNTWNAYYTRNIKDFGFKFGGIYTKNLEDKYVFMPSVGFDFWF
jgi:hypothetical protein